MNGCSLYAVFAKIAYLVLHEGYERSDDETDSVHCQSGNLECDTLTASGRHQAQSVPAAADTLYDLLLYASETVVTPVLFEYLQVVHGCLSGFLFRLVGFYALNLEQNVPLLEVVFLDGIANIKRFLGFDIAYV